MPNHVTHKLIFAAAKAEEIFAAICTEGCIDFEKLVQSPPQKYSGNLSPDDEKDFGCNWLSWNSENWGTKWNAYDGTAKVEGEMAVIQFDTAWSIPYPVIAAFCNRFQIPFEHRYFDEGSNFWGIEKWGVNQLNKSRITRVEKLFKQQETYKGLCLELKGYDPDDVEAA